MLHMVMFLLKIFGILLGVILGLLLVLILVVLLVPIRYRIWGDNREDIHGRVSVTWLLRIISLQIAYVDNKLSIKIKIFGRIFFDNNRPKKASEEKSPKTKRKTSQSKSKSLKKQTSKSKKDIELKRNQSIADKKTTDNINTEIIKLDNKSTSVIDIKDKETPNILTNKEANLNKIDCAIGQKENINIEVDLVEPIDVEKETNLNLLRKLKKIIDKFKNLFQKIKDFFRKIKLGLENIKNMFYSVYENIANIKNKWNKIKDFYNIKENKQGIKLSFYAIKKVVKHILPRKIKGQLEFGTGDPCSTGQALGVAASFYGFYGKSVQIIPNFNEQILEGNIYIYGRIRIVTLLIIGVKLILNKNFKELIKNFRALKEDL